MILLRQHPLNDDKVDAGGAAFWGSFQVDFIGKDNSLSAMEASEVQNTMIHETAHLWVGVLYQSRWKPEDKKRLFKDIAESHYDQWINEGGAGETDPVQHLKNE